MQNARVRALVFALFVIPTASAAQQTPPPAAAPPAGKTFTLSAELQSAHQNVQRNLAEAAEKMPDEHYAFRPTPDIKPFGQLVAHVALAQFSTCAALKGETSPRKDEKEEASRTKAEAIALLKASATYCDPLVAGLSDATMTEMTKMGQNQVAKGLLPMSLAAHGMQMYSTMAVYLRLKGMVPPSTERQSQQMKKSQ